MQLTEEPSFGTNQIKKYAQGNITINQETFSTSVIVSPDEIQHPWKIDQITHFSQSDVERILQMNPEVVLIGSGESLTFPEQALLAAFMEKGIGVEVMTSDAACRTYNLLANEGRTVVAAIIIE